MFEINTYKKRFDANKIVISKIGNGQPYIVRTSINNGLRGYINEDETYLNEGNTISFGQDTATMFYQEQPYFTGDKIKIMKSKYERFSKKNAQFFISAMTKSFSNFSWGSSSFNVNIIKSQKVSLPTKNSEIDFDFMEQFIAQLEHERLQKLDAYLSATGLNNYQLTEAEQQALVGFENGSVEWKEFKIDNIFTKTNLRTIKKPFNKSKDASTVPTKEFSLPLVNAKVGDNGIMFYGREKDFESTDMAIGVISNGAIATGTVYAQPQQTGILWDAYLLKSNEKSINKKHLFYLTTSLQKSIKLKFSWSYKAYWSKVKQENVQLPAKNNQPDYEYMQNLISAIQKQLIQRVVKYSEKKLV